MGEKIKLSAERLGIEFICQFLCFYRVTDFKERIIVHPEGDGVFIKCMLHHLTPIDVNL